MVVALAATIFLSLTPAKAQMVTRADSANYLFGVANGDGIRRYIIKNDTADQRKVAAFINGFNRTFGITEGPAAVMNAGTQMGVSLGQEIHTGFLFGDSSITANEKQIFSTFVMAVNGEKWTMTDEEAMQFVQKTMGNAMYTHEQIRPTAAVNDSLNYCVGWLNGRQVRQNSLGRDTTKKDVKLFMKSFVKAIKLSPDSIQQFIYTGMNIGNQFNRMLTQGYLLDDSALTVNYSLIGLGARQTIMNDSRALANPEQAGRYLQSLSMEITERRTAPLREAGEKYLAENAKREGVTVTPSGLQYEVVTMGNGPRPTDGQKVRAHYTGRLIDGTVFDSSVERGEPLEFELGRVIQGWQEGLKLMPVGSKFILYIPYNLGYGERGAGDLIPPYSTLVFEVELLSIL